MKKIIALVLIGLAIAAHNAFGQTMINTNKYFRIFKIENPAGIADNDYVWEATDAWISFIRKIDFLSLKPGVSPTTTATMSFLRATPAA